MALLTVIGRGVRVCGRITGESDLTIEGHVDGEVAVSGDVTVEAGGLVGASVSARTLTVRGAVKGDLTGEDAVRLEEGARVVGDLRAPRIAIAKGALVRGLVQTGTGERTAPRAKTGSAARPAAGPATRRAVAPPPARPAVVASKAAHPVTITKGAPPSLLAGKRPPPPVVPALKKGAKAALKKKAT